MSPSALSLAAEETAAVRVSGSACCISRCALARLDALRNRARQVQRYLFILSTRIAPTSVRGVYAWGPPQRTHPHIPLAALRLAQTSEGGPACPLMNVPGGR